MYSLSSLPDYGLSLLFWLILWSLGGIWIIRCAFRLESGEEFILGILVGLILENLLANFLGRVLPLQAAFWVSSFLIFMIGILLNIKKGWKSFFHFDLHPVQFLLFFGLFGIAYLIQRGYAIYDDYAHLPTISIMATGQIPPVFVLDPTITYAYHYFLILFSAQIVVVSKLHIWTAFDITRALVYALTIVSSMIWGFRMTRNRIAAGFTAAMMAFGSGTRWLLLLLPSNILTYLSAQISLIGAGASSGINLADALANNWAIEGAGPRPFPFAFADGLVENNAMQMFASNSLMDVAVILLLLLTYNRWRNQWGLVITVFIIGASGLLAESYVLLMAFAWLLIVLIMFIKVRGFHFPKSLKTWLLATAMGTVFAFIQGGALTDTLISLLKGIFTGVQSTSYQTIGFTFVWPPQIISTHLGVLSLFNPAQLLVALLEVGPAILILPGLFIWGIKALRASRWYEAALVFAGMISLGSLVVNFTGSTGVRNTTRLYLFIGLCMLYFVPLAWRWVSHRKFVYQLLLGVISASMLTGGLVFFAIQLAAVRTPVTSTFLKPMDVRMMESYWNQLEEHSLVFDTRVSRSATIFGRASNSYDTWYAAKPEWIKLEEDPYLDELIDAGYSYLYMDEEYWNQLSIPVQTSLSNDCMVMISELDHPRTTDYRKLYDIRSCAP